MLGTCLCAAHAEHLTEKILRHLDGVAIDAVTCLQQPSAKPCLQGVQRIARDRLLDLREQQIVVTHNKGAEGLALVGGSTKLRSGDPRCRARQLYNGARDSRCCPQSGVCTDGA